MGVPHVDLPGRLIEENMWRAIRFGLDGELLELGGGGGDAYPAPAALERLLAWTEPVRRELGIAVELPARNGAQRQRDLLSAGVELREAYARTVAETQATYAGAAMDEVTP